MSRLITGDECGLIKECIPGLVPRPKLDDSNWDPTKVEISTEKGIRRITHFNLGSSTEDDNNNRNVKLTRRRGVIDLAWTGGTGVSDEGDDSDNIDEEKGFASLLMDGTVEFWKRSDTTSDERNNKKLSHGAYRRTLQVPNVFSANEESNGDSGTVDPLTRPLSLSNLSSNTRNNGKRDLLCAGNCQGKVAVIRYDSNDDDETKNETASVVRTFSTLSIKTSQNEKRKKQYDPVASAMTVDAVNGRVATGGKDRDAALYDIESEKQVWKAKNLPPDAQTLLQPQVWPTAIAFLDPSKATSAVVGGPCIMAVGSAYSQVRIYDVRVDNHGGGGRRPVLVTPTGLLEHRVTALCQIDDYHLVAGDAGGYLQSIDLRCLVTSKSEALLSGSTPSTKSILASSALAGKFTGPAGSVRCLTKHANKPWMAAVGLDRMLRIYDIEKRKQTHCFYLKQRLNCVLMSRKNCFDESDDDDANYGEDGDLDQEDLVVNYTVDSDDDENDNDEDEVGSIEDSSDSDADEDDETEDGPEFTSRKKRRQ